MDRQRLALYSAIFTSVSALPSIAYAQDAAGGLDEIVVTAQRRDENLQDTPVTVSAFSDDMLDTRQITRTEDIADSVPSLYINNISAGPSALTITLRGSGEQVGGLATSESPVGIYLDDVYLARLSGANMDLADVERVEVLRGPQGTLYGRNTMTGAMKIVTRRPDGTTWGKAELSYGSFDAIRAKGAISGAWTDDLAVSASAYYNDRDGWFTNLGEADKRGARKTYGGRLAVATTGDGPFQAQASVFFTRDKNDGITPVPVALTAPYAPLTSGYNVTRSPIPAYGDNKQVGAIANLSYDLGEVTVTSISGYINSRDLWSLDFSGGFNNGTNVVAGFYRESASNQWQFSEELQAQGSHADGRLNWILGAYYFREKADQVLNDSFGTGVFGPFPVTLLPSSFDLSTKSWALFGQASYEIVPNLTVTAGLRYTKDTKTFDGTIQNGFGFPPTLASVTNARTWDAFTPKFGLDYKVTENVLLFGSVSRGFRAGGFNGLAVANTSVFGRVYDPETVWAFEGGVKSTLFEGKMTANFAYFRNDLNGLQQNVVVPPASTRTENVGDATMQGFEVELNTQFIDGFNIYASGSLLFDKYDRLIPTSQAAVFGAERLPLVSKFQGQVGFAYAQPVGGDVSLFLNGDWNHRSPRFADPTNNPLGYIGTQDQLNAGVGFGASDGRWQVMANVRNLTDEEDYYSGLALIPGLIAVKFFEEPRTWSVTFRYKIGE